MSRLFGTDGIRGRADTAPLDAATLRSLGRALGEVLARDLRHAVRIVIARDTRMSGPAVMRALAAGLSEAGASVRSAGVAPTPAVSLLARGPDFDAGVMISASHNAWHDNGLKVFSSAGTKLDDALEREVEEALDRMEPTTGRASLPEAPRDEAELNEAHARWLAERARASGLRLEGLVLVIDCANGAASPAAASLLRELGADVIAIADRPNGRNINAACGSLHLEGLVAAVMERGAGLGAAFDGDADRALFVDEEGETLDGDQVLLLSADWMKRSGALRGSAVVGTVMSNFGLERALAERGLGLERAAVGDRFVLERMRELGCNLGGEQSGHVIFLDEAPAGDGLLTTLKVLQALRESDLSLAELNRSFPRTPQLLRNLSVGRRRPLEELPGWTEVEERWRLRFGTDGRFVVRYSGTENLVRIMAEGLDADLVQACVSDMSAHLERALGA